MIRRIKFLGYDFIAEKNIKIVAAKIIDELDFKDAGKLPIIFTPNVDYLVKLDRSNNAIIREKLKNSLYILPDGQPIVWAAKFLGIDIRYRLTGSDLFLKLFDLANAKGIRSLYITPNEKVSQYFEKVDAVSKCYTLPIFQISDQEAIQNIVNRCVELIVNNNIRIVYIGVSFPKQDILSFLILDTLKEMKFNTLPLIGLLGASLEFKSGYKKRAPILYQKLGLEWGYRFINEPNRLFKRYFIDSFAFIKILKKYRK